MVVVVYGSGMKDDAMWHVPYLATFAAVLRLDEFNQSITSR